MSPFLKRLFVVWGCAWVLFLFNAGRIIATQSKGEAYTPHTDRGGKYLKNAYWGPVTSNIDWCETNYALSPYIAEFFNSLTSLAFVVAGIYGIVQCRRTGADIKFTLCCIGIALVGVGSTLFHATMLRETQTADEAPMGVVSSLFLYIMCTSHPGATKARKRNLATFLTIYTSAMYAIMFIFPEKAWIFHLTLVWIVAACVIVMVQIYKEADGKEPAFHPRLQPLIEYTIAFAIISWTLWSVEPLVCNSLLGHLQLHAWWHLGMASACFCLLHSLISYRFTHLGKAHELVDIISPRLPMGILVVDTEAASHKTD